MIKYTDPPQSRNEEILKATIDGTTYDKEPQSRIEDLLLELKATIEGGGGGGTTNYNNLENRPQINGNTLEGNMSFENLGIDETPTEDSTNAVASGGVYAGLSDKIDKSSTGYETITGNPLEFDSPSPQMVSMKCDIVASQDLHGYGKPWAGGSRKNKLPLVLSDIKAWNTSGTWSDNKYTIRNCEIEFDTNGDFVTSIRFKNTSNEQFNLYLYQGTLPEGSYILNGCPANGSTSTYWQSMVYGYDDVGDGISFTSDGQTNFNLQIVVRVNINMDNKIFYPMVRLATETDPTFEPYSNICPISGTDEVEIEVTGKNRFDKNNLIPGGYNNVSHSFVTATSAFIGTCYIKVEEGETFTISGMKNWGISSINCFVDSNLEYISTVGSRTYGGGYAPNVSVTVPSNAEYLAIASYYVELSEDIIPYNDSNTIQVELGSQATSYEPYKGSTTTISLPQTVYDGEVDVTTGELKVTDVNIASYAGESLPSTWISDRDEYTEGGTPTTGAQVVYKLATPQTIQLTPTQVWAVQGENTITVSVDGVEAEIHSSNYATLKDINDLWEYIKQSPQGISDGVRFGASNLEMIGGTMG